MVPTWPELAALVTVGLCGGLAHILLTESYRLAPASLVAPFDYTSMVWAFLLGYFFFAELPTVYVFVGAAIIAAAGSVRDLARAPARAATCARGGRAADRCLRTDDSRSKVRYNPPSVV